MKFYSTNNRAIRVDLKQAVLQGLAPDNGLYMPEHIPTLPKHFFDTLSQKTFNEIAFDVASALLGDSLAQTEIKKIVDHTIQFDAPLVQLEEGVSVLELFHGPTLAFKDFGARFLSGLFANLATTRGREITILVATSGDTGSAVANGFLDVPGTSVIVLYPKGKVSDIQEKQFTTLGRNITALEISGTFDDCQRLVKEAFLDSALKDKLFLTSANSINIARLIPQSFYYFYAFAQLKKPEVVFSVPSGNFGNLTAGLLAMRMGLPVKQFIAATNANDIVPHFLQTGNYSPRPSTQTISNAMDVGSPSNFARLMDMVNGDVAELRKLMTGFSFSDAETRKAMVDAYASANYILDPHGAVGYLGLKKYRKSNPGLPGVFLETAHPGKFKDVVEEVIGSVVGLPARLSEFLKGKKLSTELGNDYAGFKEYLLQR